MNESPIFVKTFDFLKWTLGHTEKFPKSQRFFLAKRINDAIFDFYEAIGEAVLAEGNHQVRCLKEADVYILRLKHYFRLAQELRYVSFRQYQYAIGELREIGCLLGGWLKTHFPPKRETHP